MKLKKTLLRAAAALLISLMAFGLVGCSYKDNPLVAKVGGEKIYMNEYYSAFQSYASQSSGMNAEQYANFVLDQVILKAVQRDQLNVQNITLTEEDEAKVQEDVDNYIKEYVEQNYLSKVDEKITDENERYNEAFKLFVESEVKEAGTDFDTLRAGLVDTYRQNARAQKLYDKTVEGVSVTVDSVRSYIFNQINKQITAKAFKTGWDNFIKTTNKTLPLFMPHPENAIEDDPDTEADEHVDADPTKAFFAVERILIKFAAAPTDEEAKDLTAFAEKDKDFGVKVNSLDEAIPTLTLEQFLERAYSSDTNDDPEMKDPYRQYFGYLMQQDVISDYDDGFGYAAMKLMFGEEWQSEKDKKNASNTSADDPAANGPEYEVTMMDLADGNKVAKVLSDVGMIYVVLHNTDYLGKVYAEDGNVKLPVYDGDNPVAGENGFTTVSGGTVTEAEINEINEIFANIKLAPSDEGEKTDEEAEPVTIKSVFDYYQKNKLNAEQSMYYQNMLTEWKNNTKIKVKKNIIKSFYQG